jgi:hypothetical protein
MVGLIYGETEEDYDMAALHMSQFLELVPDGDCAKIAWEKMYLWEGKAKEAGAQ